MPTNVTPEYRKAEEAFREARTTEEKIVRLEDMIALLPKHKGTDHLFADLKRRMAKLKAEQEATEASGRRSGRGSGPDFTREGAAQAVLLGPPNSGKSSILKALTHAAPEIAEYPFTTQHLLPGMMSFQDVQIQLVDSPPVTSEFMPLHLPGLVRGADAALLVTDLGSEAVLEDLETLLRVFSLRQIHFVTEPVSGGGDREPDSAEAANQVRALVLANKSDLPGASERLELLRGLLGGRLEVRAVSTRDPEGLKALPELLFRWLRIVRVYTKTPGRKPDLERPYTVFAGHTVGDICARIHKDFAEKLRFARLWRGDAGPLTVSRDEPLEDRDVLELHL
jgi:ribosome-interacting GTPase 1